MDSRNPPDTDHEAVQAAAPPAPADAEGTEGRGVKSVAIAVVAIAALILGWSVTSDRLVPSTNRSALSAQVMQIAPRVSGRVVELFVQDNQVVATGDPLFRIDPRPYELAVAQAQAQLQNAAQGVSASVAQIEAGQAQVAQARVGVEQATLDAERLARLAERGVVTRVQADDAQKRLEAARAAHDAAVSQVESARRQLGDVEDNPQLDAAQLALEQAEYDLASTLVVAPAPGAISNLQFAPGRFLGAGTPALTFISAEDLWITAEFRENQLGNIRPGDPVRISFDAIPGQIFEGSVGSIGWGVYAGPTQSNGLPVNTAPTQWFEPARRLPVRIDLNMLPLVREHPIRVGGQADILVLTDRSGIVGGVARGILRLRSILSYLN